MNRISMISALLFAGAFSIFSSCEKEESPKDSNLSFEYEYKVGSADFNYGQVYNIGGVAVQFAALQFYVGGIEMHPETGEHVSATTEYLLVKPDAGAQEVVTLPKGHYHEVKFFIGVGADDNSQTEADFTARPATDPLSLQNPRMNWSWNAGYIFFRIDGQIDSNGDGTPDAPLEMHIGTNNYLTNLALDLHEDIDQNDQTLGFTLDVEKLFTNIDLLTESVTHTGDKPAVATKLVGNFATAFTVK